MTLAVFVLVLVSALLQGSLGGLMPFLQADIPMSHTIGSLHITALAVGGLLAATVAERVRRRHGRMPILIGAAVLGATGAALISTAQTAVMSVGALVLVGFAMSSTLIAGQALLVALHGRHGAQMIGELNVAYSIGAVAAAAALPVVAATALGWRGFPAVQAALLLVVVVPLLLRGRAAMDADSTGAASRQAATALRRPRAAYAAMCLSVAVEWSFIFWTATHLVDVGGFSAPTAAGAASVMWAAIVAGRVLGSRLVGVLGAPPVLVASLLVGLAAAAVLTFATTPFLAVLAAGLGGLAAANLYPASIALVVSGFPHRPDAAVARASLLTSATSIAFPLMLGALADVAGLQLAFMAVPVTALLALGAIRIAGPAPTAKPNVAASDQTDQNYQGATT
ncbi:MFS transporter [Cellulomonas cellasea]|uniref:MFS transporter n=1 Tax=Cellulomonas cellasea TaxID=43670 RepID=UPI0025A48872|nr:MFS transporter [Cellulomonas cellasea]MDM8085231.1 MFS transporter [Cellulomonas cellasea]